MEDEDKIDSLKTLANTLKQYAYDMENAKPLDPKMSGVLRFAADKIFEIVFQCPNIPEDLEQNTLEELELRNKEGNEKDANEAAFIILQHIRETKAHNANLEMEKLRYKRDWD